MAKTRKGLFMVVYTLESGKPEYVILKRHLHWKGWEFPKSGVKSTESKKQAVKREVKEETGLEIINITSHKYKGEFKYQKEFSDRKGYTSQTYFLYSVEAKKSKIVHDKREHTSGKWVDFKTANKMLTYLDQKDSLKIVDNWLKEKLSIMKHAEAHEKRKEKENKKS